MTWIIPSIIIFFILFWAYLFFNQWLKFITQANEIELNDRRRTGEIEQLELEVKKLKYEQVAGKHWNS